jgi:hypothetical protein
MMSIKPADRPTAAECLQNPWLNKRAEDEPQDAEATQNALRTLRRFRTEQKLQQAALTFIVC